MTKEPKPRRGMPRSLIYLFIPLGFIILILVMVLGGFWAEETTEEPRTVEEEPTAPLNQ